MITDEKELQKIADFTRRAKERGFSAQQVDGFLKSKGSSLAEAAGIIQYGAKNVARSRLAGKKPSMVSQIFLAKPNWGVQCYQHCKVSTKVIRWYKLRPWPPVWIG